MEFFQHGCLAKRNRLTRFAAATVAAASFLAVTAGASDAIPAHRIYGKWTWTYSKNNCTEVYDYHSDNTSTVTSGEEVAQSRFTIDDKPDSNGFYRMTDEVTKSNGGTGCDGQAGGSPVGDKATLYIKFHPTRDEMIVCEHSSLDACFGPLRRVTE